MARSLMVAVAVAALVVALTAGAAVAVFMVGSIVGAWWQLRRQRRRPQPRKRRRLSNEERQAILERDGWACVYCGSTTELELDHVIPFSKGGACTAANLVTACGPCNRAKGAS